MRTPLYQEHVTAGARIIDFGGWYMPVSYKPGIKKEHTAVRQAIGLFDVSHMGEFLVRGPDAIRFVDNLVTGNAASLADGDALYTLLCLENGGIVDDLIVYRHAGDEVLLIVNASNIDKDFRWVSEHTGNFDVECENQSADTALIAVQGPRAVALVDRLASGQAESIGRFKHRRLTVAGVDALVARTGYTGEDGFELACAAESAVPLWRGLLEEGAADGAMPIGLGARDTLRLEARLSLYGNDIDETTNPIEAGLGWAVKLDAGDFIGKDAIAAAKAQGPSRKLVGFTIEGRGIPRQGYAIRARGGSEDVGQVTSGTTGITVGAAIGLGYVPADMARAGTELTIDCRGKDADAVVHKGPFYRRP